MHKECADFVTARARTLPGNGRVIEFGGLDVNGQIRHVVPHAFWYCVDIVSGPGVDEVNNAATWRTENPYNIAIALEVFEHTPEWPAIVESMSLALVDGGVAIMTAATNPRPPHGAYGAHGVPEGEYYGNVDVQTLTDTVTKYFSSYTINVLQRGDVQVEAWK